jgi:hypothetical protein
LLRTTTPKARFSAPQSRSDFVFGPYVVPSYCFFFCVFLLNWVMSIQVCTPSSVFFVCFGVCNPTVA